MIGFFFTLKEGEVRAGFNRDGDLFILDENGKGTRVETGFGPICIECHYYNFNGKPDELSRKQHAEIVSGFLLITPF